MRRIKQLLFACFAVALLAAHVPSKAAGHNDDDNNSKTTASASGTDNSGTNLPVNNNIAFLIVIGAAIGTKVITDKIKSSRQQK